MGVFILMRPQRGLALESCFDHKLSMADALNERAEELAGQFTVLRGSLLAWFQRRVINRVDAEDLVQEAFLRVAQREGFETVVHLEGYIFRTAASVLSDRYRRQAVRHADLHVPFEEERDQGRSIDPFRIVAGREALDRAEAALLELPERTRSVFLLRRIDGLRFREIAIRLGISVSAAEKHMVRALEHLAEQLGDQS